MAGFNDNPNWATMRQAVRAVEDQVFYGLLALGVDGRKAVAERLAGHYEKHSHAAVELIVSEAPARKVGA